MLATLHIFLGHVDGQLLAVPRTFIDFELCHCLTQQCDNYSRMIDTAFDLLDRGEYLLFRCGINGFHRSAHTEELTVENTLQLGVGVFFGRRLRTGRHQLTGTKERLLALARVFRRFVVINAWVLSLYGRQAAFDRIAK